MAVKDDAEAQMGATTSICLLDGDLYAGDPYPTFRWMRDNAPAYFDEISGVWGLTRYADVKAAGQDPQRFSNAGGSRPDTGAFPFMIDMDAPEHRRRRRIVSNGFTPAGVRDQEDRIRRVCQELVDAVAEKGRCDLVAELAAPLPLIVIADMIGFPEQDWGVLLEWSDQLLCSQSGDPAAIEKAAAVFVEWRQYISEQIAQRRRSGSSDDLIGVLVHAEQDGEKLSDEEIVYELILILIGGDETTRHVISGGIEALLRRPEQWEALCQDRSLIPGAVEEMLRWVSPIKNMNRTVTCDVEIHGKTLHAGDKVLLLYPSANRDERQFPNPDTFDIRRQPNDHVAFGHGAHLCLGNRLARAELRHMVETLVERLPDLRLADPQAELPMRRSYFISGLEAMPVEFSALEG